MPICIPLKLMDAILLRPVPIDSVRCPNWTPVDDPIGATMPILLQHQLNHPINTPVGKPKPYDRQPGPPYQLPPLLLAALQRRQAAHHVHVRPRGRLRAVLGRQDVLVEDDFRVAWFHGRGRVAEDGAGEGVGPVVQDVVEEVCACACRFPPTAPRHLLLA